MGSAHRDAKGGSALRSRSTPKGSSLISLRGEDQGERGPFQEDGAWQVRRREGVVAPVGHPFAHEAPTAGPSLVGWRTTALDVARVGRTPWLPSWQRNLSL